MKLKDRIKFLLPYTGNLGRYMFFVVLGFMVSAMSSVAVAAWFRWVADAELNEEAPTIFGDGLEIYLPFLNEAIAIELNSNALIAYSLVFFVILLGVGNLMGMLGSGMIARSIASGVRADLFRKMMSLPFSSIIEESEGRAASRAVYTASKMSLVCKDLIVNLFRHGGEAIFLLSYMLWLNVTYTLILFSLIFLLVLILLFAGRFIRILRRGQQRAMERLSGLVNEALNGFKMVRIYQTESQYQEKFSSFNIKHEINGFRVLLIEGGIRPPLIAMVGFMVATMAYLVMVDNTDDLTFGTLSSYFIATGILFGSMRALIRINTIYQTFIATTDDIIYDLLREEEQDSIGEAFPDEIQEISVVNLGFTYPNGAKILEDINFTIKRGDYVAIAGQNGSGKSTLMNILTRFLTADQGHIKFDDVDSRVYSLRSFREHIALVSQDVILFDDTIKNNLLIAQPNATQADIEQAAKWAHAHSFISKLPDGYDTKVGKSGALLSGGQRQRLALARALIRKPKILFLDEATSALDVRAENAIIETLENLDFKPTIIAVSHRPQQLDKADYVILLENGKLIAQGDHKSLVKDESSFYNALFKNQNDGIASAPKIDDVWEKSMLDESNSLPADWIASAGKAMPEEGIQKVWQQRASSWQPILLPLSALFGLVVTLRKRLYKFGILRSINFPMATVVVGNIRVGGTGKTPAVMALSEYLTSKGYKVGILSRGYGGKSRFYPQLVTSLSNVIEVGDESLMIAKNTTAKVVISPSRQQGAEFLHHLGVNVMLMDDGLQHYRLGRDIEICLQDQASESSNKFLLPAGPYREPKRRLNKVDFILQKGISYSSNKSSNNQRITQKTFTMNFTPESFVNVKTKQVIAVEHWPKGIKHEVIAAIAQPQSFFKTLDDLNLVYRGHTFSDHYSYQEEDLDFDNAIPVLMTEKDAIKCESFDYSNLWYLKMKPTLDADFLTQFDTKLLQALTKKGLDSAQEIKPKQVEPIFQAVKQPEINSKERPKTEPAKKSPVKPHAKPQSEPLVTKSAEISVATPATTVETKPASNQNSSVKNKADKQTDSTNRTSKASATTSGSRKKIIKGKAPITSKIPKA